MPKIAIMLSAIILLYLTKIIVTIYPEEGMLLFVVILTFYLLFYLTFCALQMILYDITLLIRNNVYTRYMMTIIIIIILNLAYQLYSVHLKF